MSNLVQTGLFDTRAILEVLDPIPDGKGRFAPVWTSVQSLQGRFTGTTGSSSSDWARSNRNTTGSFHCATRALSPTVPGYVRDGRRVRLIYRQLSGDRYFEVIGMPIDKGERERQTRFSIIERDANWVGQP